MVDGQRAVSRARRGRLAAVLLLAVSICAQAQSGEEPNEKALWVVWQRQSATPNDHAAMIAACREFEKRSPADPFLVVTRGIAAWHLLKAGEVDAAGERLAPMLNVRSSDLLQAASEMARAWTTRLDREVTTASLKAYYRREIAFPESLEALRAEAGHPTPPLADRWAEPWEYRLTGFQQLKGLRNQKYDLRSRTLGPTSDLAGALKIPYASRIRIRPVRLMSSDTMAKVVQFVTEPSSGSTGDAGEIIHISVGARHGRIFFPFMGKHLILLSDGNHWKVLPKPRG